MSSFGGSVPVFRGFKGYPPQKAKNKTKNGPSGRGADEVIDRSLMGFTT